MMRRMTENVPIYNFNSFPGEKMKAPEDPILELYEDGTFDEDDDPVIVLTCTAHGTPVWRIWNRASESLSQVSIDRNVNNPPPHYIIENPFSPPWDIDLDDPTTWSLDPNWNKTYARTGEGPEDWTF
jgi:hypothetical protein